MERRKNPYAPGAGTTPPALTGRADEVEEFEILIDRLQAGRHERSIVIHGLRGVGKTVLLSEFADIASRAEWLAEYQEMRSDINFRQRMAEMVNKIVLQLSRKARNAKRIEQLKGVLKSFSLTATPEGVVSATMDVEPALGYASSGDIEQDLVDLFVDLGETARDADTGVVFLFDELQLLKKQDIEALAAATHRVGQGKPLPVAVIAAGLPSLPSMFMDAKSYSERLFAFRELGRLTDEAARAAVALPAKDEGVDYGDKALQQILKYSGGYPYFIQEWGYETWNYAAGNPIDEKDVTDAKPIVQNKLDRGFFAIRLERTTPAERKYLAGMAELGDEPQTTTDVARAAGYDSIQTASPIRQFLIDKGLIYSSARGNVAYTVPHFADYMRRTYSQKKNEKVERVE